MFHYSNGVEPYILPIDEAYTPSEKRFYSLSYRPKDRVNASEYIKGVDVIAPVVSTGFAYECSSSGISAISEPVFSTKERGKTVDGTVEWKAIPYHFLLKSGDTITDSTWRGLNGEAFDTDSIVNGIQTRFRLTGVALGVSAVTMINHISITLVNGDLAELESAMIIPVVEY